MVNYETFAKRPLLPPPKNSGGSGSNFNPQNTTSITACPVGPADRTGVVNPPKFGGGSPFLALNKIERFAKVSLFE
jgi:hypothetical protein